MLLKIWKDPVWSKVISVGILAVLATLAPLATWFFGYWPLLVRSVGYIFDFVISTISIPIWLLVLVVPFIASVFPLYQKFSKKKEPRFTYYKKDNFFEIDWLWDWAKPNFHNANYSVKNLTPRCPSCNSILDRNDYRGKLFECINHKCKWTWQRPWNGRDLLHYHEIEKRIRTEIDRKVHCGEFNLAVNKSMQPTAKVPVD